MVFHVWLILVIVSRLDKNKTDQRKINFQAMLKTKQKLKNVFANKNPKEFSISNSFNFFIKDFRVNEFLPRIFLA